MTNRHRLSSRILLVDEQGSVLLFLTTAPDTSGFSRWITPGGGVDPGESHEEAGIRELFEETGLVVDALGEPVWTHDFTVAWDAADHDTGHAEFYALTTTRFTPATDNWTDDEHVDVVDHRWWSIAELESTAEPFEPANLIDLLSRGETLLHEGEPS